MGKTGYWDVLVRGWRVVVAGGELGVGVALAVAWVADSTRPLSQILIGLAAGAAVGLCAVRPAASFARRGRAGGGRHWVTPGRTTGTGAQPPQIVAFPPVRWPDPQLSESPRPTFAPPARR